MTQDMTLKVYGHYGKPMVVFPAQSGRFYDYENFGMVEAVQNSINAGKIKLYAVDSIDSQSWANWEAHPAVISRAAMRIMTATLPRRWFHSYGRNAAVFKVNALQPAAVWAPTIRLIFSSDILNYSMALSQSAGCTS